MGAIQQLSNFTRRLLKSESSIFDKHQAWESFSFGDTESSMAGHDILDYFHTWHNGDYLEPPINFDSLYKAFRSSPHHSSAIYLKRNVLVSTRKKASKLDFTTLDRATLNAGIFGNAFIRKRMSKTGRLLGFEYLPSKYVRRINAEQYGWVGNPGEITVYKKNEVFHFSDTDVNQEYYGLPEYLSGLQAAWLNESATLYRRRYYDNGSHAGFIMYITDPAKNEDDINELRRALKNSKGPGNFRNLFMYAPGGKKDGLQVLPVADIAAKDEFFNIKNVSRDDVLAAHRVPPQMMSIIPTNTTGFGAADTAAEVFARNEILPLQQRWMAINEWMEDDVLMFDDYEVVRSVEPSTDRLPTERLPK